MLKRHIACALCIALLGCTQEPGQSLDQPETPAAHPPTTSLVLVDPANIIQDQWLHLPMNGASDYRLAHLDDRLAIRAEGRRSASALIRRVAFSPESCSRFQWTWRVDQLQASARLDHRDHEDVAAGIFLLFGDPGFLSDPDPVPTLRYVWTNDSTPVDTVVDNPYLSGVVRSVVVRSGEDHLGHWVEEERDLMADYERAFGSPPKGQVAAIAVFTDNDQTGEPVLSYYGTARVLCNGPA